MLRSLASNLLKRHPQAIPIRFLRGGKSREPLPDEAASDTGGDQDDIDAQERRRQRARVLQQLERSNPAGKGFTSNHIQDGENRFSSRREMNQGQGQGRNRDEDHDQFGPPRRDTNWKQGRNRDEDNDHDQEDRRRSRWQDQSSRPSQSFSNNFSRGRTSSSGPVRRAYKDEEGENLPGSGGRVRKMLDQASTFSDLQLELQEEQGQKFPEGQGKGQVLPRPDRYMSSPYTKETRIPNKVFHGGDSALQQAQLQKIDPATTSVIVFPGQGTQYVGMCGDVSRMPDSILSLYRTASQVLGYDLLDLCQNGPLEKLNKTVHCQPAVFVSSLAALERLRERNPNAIESCVATAGFSVGEITALVFAGVFSFEDALQLIKVRAEAMQLATEMVPSAMATVLYAADSKLNYALKIAKAWCTKEHQIENPVCSIANYLFPHCKVVGGNKEAIEFLQDNYKDFNLVRVKRLPVSGAFHTELMFPAAEAVRLYLNKIEVNPARIPVFCNATSHRYHTSHELLRVLPKQIHRPVMWEQILHNLYQRPQDIEYPSTYECGPGQSLTTVLKLVNARARMKTESIDP